MISTSIDGSGAGQGDLANFLALMSDPSGQAVKLAEKLVEVQAAIAENLKIVELVGPAREIATLRDQAIADRAEAESVLAAAKLEAEGIVSDALASAAATKDKAVFEASALRDEAKKVNAEAKKLKASLAAALDDAKAAHAEADEKIAEAATAAEAVSAQADTLAKAAADLAAEKQDIVDRHKQFIESL